MSHCNIITEQEGINKILIMNNSILILQENVHTLTISCMYCFFQNCLERMLFFNKFILLIELNQKKKMSKRMICTLMMYTHNKYQVVLASVEVVT